MSKVMNDRLIGAGILILIGALILSGAIKLPLNMVPTGYQGPKPSFYAVQYGGKVYTADNPNGASAAVFSTYLDFDPDEATSGIGNLAGEETSIFVPKASYTSVPDWVPNSWGNELNYMSNPIHVYTWQVKLSNGSVIQYRMEEWVLKWFVSISYEWDSDAEAYSWDGWNAVGKEYHNAVVWFKIDLSSLNWYFKPVNDSVPAPNKVFFGIAKIVPQHVYRYLLKRDDNIVNNDASKVSKIRVTPMSAGSVMPIYTDFMGSEAPAVSASQLEGAELNPSMFRKAVYTNIILNDFGAQAYNTGAWGAFGTKVYGDVVTYDFNVHVFVVGQWLVKDIQQVNNDYGREGRYDVSLGPLSPLGDLIKNPLFWLATGIAALIAVAVFAPTALIALAEAFRIVRHK